jgi:hypothetical protein
MHFEADGHSSVKIPYHLVNPNIYLHVRNVHKSVCILASYDVIHTAIKSQYFFTFPNFLFFMS